MARDDTSSLVVPAAPGDPAAGASWVWTLRNPSAPKLPETVDLRWRWIPPGRFRMGARGYYPDEEPVHEVTVRFGFWMLETPVTQAQWLAVQGGENPSYHQPETAWATHPVERIHWPMACEWCAALTARSHDAGLRGRVDLPTEAQWEYACRAGSDAEYCNGDGEEALDRVGWYVGNSGTRTQSVGGKARNDWGLRDMHGNVWEWCRDPWNPSLYHERAAGAFAEDVETGTESSPRSLRGGYAANSPVGCRSAYRVRGRPELGVGRSGFRACWFPGPEQA